MPILFLWKKLSALLSLLQECKKVKIKIISGIACFKGFREIRGKNNEKNHKKNLTKRLQSARMQS